jgi:putative PIN family toxin of toxin-antitoxin system
VRRVVVDPGVLVSAIIAPEGPPSDIVRAFREGRLEIVACPHLLAELLGVLQRDKFRRYLTVEEARQYVAGLASQAEIVRDPPVVPSVSRDPNDDYLIALARLANADAIVSGDADLLTIDDSTPPIVRPAEFVEGLAR